MGGSSPQAFFESLHCLDLPHKLFLLLSSFFFLLLLVLILVLLLLLLPSSFSASSFSSSDILHMRSLVNQLKASVGKNRAISTPYMASLPNPVTRWLSLAAMLELGHDWASTMYGPVLECEKGVEVWLDERAEAQCCDSGHL